MKSRNWAQRWAGKCAAAAACVAVAGCNGLPAARSPAIVPDDTAAAQRLAQIYRELAARAPEQTFALDPTASHIRIYVFRGGAAATSGHNHVLSVPDFEGYAYVPEHDVTTGRFDLRLRLDQLSVDDPEARRQAGGAYAAALDDDAIGDTRAHMLGPRNLDAARYPYVTLRVRRVSGELPRLVAAVSVQLHGVQRELLLPLRVAVVARELQVGGTFALRQSDFGITPYSILGGLLAVRDEISIEFDLRGRPFRSTH
ncbi:MAG: YceI family protein [Steroidobacterales bacterium]